MSAPSSLYIGLMSGTSLDGVDGVLADFSGTPRVLAHASCGFAGDFRAQLLALNTPGEHELHRAALAANQLARHYAEVVAQLLAQASGTPAGPPASSRPGPAHAPHDAWTQAPVHARVHAIGAHGQTVRHQPQAFGGPGYTLQINNPALLAELTGIDVVADFRTADLAAGGQGAPLVPGFHAALWARPDATVAVLNIGGISNLTVLRPGGQVLGFDCGPGNALLDHWCQQHTGQPYDDGGRWAASGRVHDALLAALLAEPFFAQSPPKSTGRDLFHPGWLQARLDPLEPGPAPEDVQATLTALTARACARDLQAWAPEARELQVCGGGALNQTLMQALQAALPGVAVQPTDVRGLPAQQVEATAFAWLAKAFCERQPASLPAVTGARGPRVLGALYPSSRHLG